MLVMTSNLASLLNCCLISWNCISKEHCSYSVPVCTRYISNCTATTPVSHPTSLRNFPNGCQGHPRSYPPPRIPTGYQTGSNSVLTRCSFYSTVGIGWQKMHKAVEAWKQKKIHINNMYKFHIFIQCGIYFLTWTSLYPSVPLVSLCSTCQREKV